MFKYIEIFKGQYGIFMKYALPKFEYKIITPEQLTYKIAQIKLKSPLVFTNGCFDILHRGHVTYLAQARSLGAAMIVALNSDASVKRQNKGDNRPLNSWKIDWL